MGRNGKVIFSRLEPLAGLREAVRIGREEVRGIVTDSRLRGRGGAGFPTGVKWNLASAQAEERRYVIGNADEGEPGTFKDRFLIEEHAGLVLEGMIIAAYAIGAREGIFYLREEYRHLRPRIEAALEDLRREGALGRGILGEDGFDLEIEIRMGAGAYVCGEETALIESLEGQRGEPRNRPPFPVDSGFNGCPTVVHNLETLALVPHIVVKGADWFRAIGTERSAGTKLLSVSGDCERPGVYEFPFGVTVRRVLREVGGIEAKAVQIGGASGECVPRKDFGRRIAFEDIPTNGSFIVFGPERRMLDVAGNFLEFFREESCGQCTPCREGIPVLIEGLERIRRGAARSEDLADLSSLAETMQDASKCGLGQTASRALMSILENFRTEYTGTSSARRTA